MSYDTLVSTQDSEENQGYWAWLDAFGDTFYEIDLPEDYIETTSADQYMVNKKIIKQ